MKVFVVDDEPLIREGLRHTLNADPEFQVVGESANARDAFLGIERTLPDVVLMDLALPGMDGAAAARDLRLRVPGVKVLVLTIHDRLRDALEVLAAGARGFALKTEPLPALLAAIRTVAAGRRYVTPSLASMVHLRQADLEGAAGDVLGTLSIREREVFHQVASGATSVDIARELCISRKTVETHVARIHRKLGCRRVADIVRFAAVHGLLRTPPPLTGGDAQPLDGGGRVPVPAARFG
jgi:DNA-binding NarL/FixJ family response regulator